MNSWELVAEAIKNPGMKIAAEGWQSDSYTYYDKNRNTWINDTGLAVSYDFKYGTWKKYNGTIKTIKWYRPKVIWHKSNDTPTIFPGRTRYFKSKKKWHDKYEYMKVIEWSVIEAPEKYEDIQAGKMTIAKRKPKGMAI